MAGTHDGGKRAAQNNKARYGDNFYVNIGKKGGHASTGGGFAASPERARWAGRKGGQRSKRTSKKQEA